MTDKHRHQWIETKLWHYACGCGVTTTAWEFAGGAVPWWAKYIPDRIPEVLS